MRFKKLTQHIYIDSDDRKMPICGSHTAGVNDISFALLFWGYYHPEVSEGVASFAKSKYTCLECLRHWGIMVNKLELLAFELRVTSVIKNPQQ